LMALVSPRSDRAPILSARSFKHSRILRGVGTSRHLMCDWSAVRLEGRPVSSRAKSCQRSPQRAGADPGGLAHRISGPPRRRFRDCRESSAVAHQLPKWQLWSCSLLRADRQRHSTRPWTASIASAISSVRRISAMAASKSSASAAIFTSSTSNTTEGLSTLAIIARRRRLGTTSRKSSRRFPARSAV
jgi:hypothetical protein